MPHVSSKPHHNIVKQMRVPLIPSGSSAFQVLHTNSEVGDQTNTTNTVQVSHTDLQQRKKQIARPTLNIDYAKNQGGNDDDEYSEEQHSQE